MEDPGNPSSGVRGVGCQVMGADDGYICQFEKDTGAFWGARNSLELGACFKTRPGVRAAGAPRQVVAQVRGGHIGGVALVVAGGSAGRRCRAPCAQRLFTTHTHYTHATNTQPTPNYQSEFDTFVEAGFQASSTWQQGAIVAAETGASGAPMSTVPSCSWAFQVNPIVGWGAASRADGGGGKATAGWLSVLSVFEPHWQVGRGGAGRGGGGLFFRAVVFSWCWKPYADLHARTQPPHRPTAKRS